MADMHDVKVRVVSVEGECHAGHKVGEEFIVSGKTPEGICVHAYTALDPMIKALMFKGSIPWSHDPGVCTLCCPDHDNPVLFELRRLG